MKNKENEVVALFEKTHGRKPSDEELKALRAGSRLSIEQLKMAGCMINYPEPHMLAAIEFETRHARKPNDKEMEALKKGANLSLEQLKMSGCLINYPQT